MKSSFYSYVGEIYNFGIGKYLRLPEDICNNLRLSLIAEVKQKSIEVIISISCGWWDTRNFEMI